MGRIVEKKRKKKKGRPSLLDLQKRDLKLQQQLLNKHNKNLLNSQFNPISINSNNTIIINSNNLNNKITHKKPTPPPPAPPPPSSRKLSSGVVRRSTRRNPNPNSDDDLKKKGKKLKRAVKGDDDDGDDDEDGEEEEEEEEDELQDGEVNSGDDGGNSGSADDGNGGRGLRKRKIESISGGSGGGAAAIGAIDKLQDDKQSISATNQTNIESGSNKQDDGPFTPLPDKKLLLFILDRLQKKDTYGVFADPVDPEELPDYHEVIDDPMDFSTVRKKIEEGAYGNLEQFEKDIFLICSNAMQYNAPDTIYFRQARSIHELAIKNFENLRQDSDDNEVDPEPKVVRRGRPPTKHLKRPPGRPPLERASSDFPKSALAAAGGSASRPTNEHRKASPHIEKYGSTDSFARTLSGSRNGDAYVGWSAERFERSDGMIGSASKGISMKLGKKQIVLDENRRNTYNHSYALVCRHEPSVLTTLQGERKQLISVGLHTEYGYARSLARFAAKLGPVAWKVASKKIERCLPSGIKFGHGWVGENDTRSERSLQKLPDVSGQSSTPVIVPACADSCSAPTQGLVESSGDMSEQKPQGEQLSEMHVPADPVKSNNESNKVTSSPEPVVDSGSVSSASMLSSAAGSNLTAAETSASFGPSSVVNMISSSTGPTKSDNSVQIHQSSAIQPRINGVNGSYGLNYATQMGKMTGAARPTVLSFQSDPSIVAVTRTESQYICPPSSDYNVCGEGKLSADSIPVKAGDCSPNSAPQQKVGSAPPDLNVGVQSPTSPVSVKADAVQPDLALQL